MIAFPGSKAARIARWAKGAAERLVDAGTYAAGDPYPHVVIDNFFDADALRAVVAEWPRAMRFKHTVTTMKSWLSDMSALGKTTQAVIGALNSQPFLDRLGAMTGIRGLIADPGLEGAGLHAIPFGGFLNIHADFNWHPGLHATRRLNLLLYLNSGWQDEWNGHLLLCDRARTVRQRIAPEFNRAVVFTTTDESWHGHPEPLRSPSPRRSIALYYYEKTPPPAFAHSTIYTQVEGGS